MYPEVTTRHVLRTYWRAARRYKALLVLLVAAISFSTTIDLVIPLWYKRFFDVIANVGAPDPNLSSSLIRILLGVFALNFLAWLSWRAASFVNNFFQVRVMTDLREHSFEYLLDHSYSFFTSTFVGSLVQKVNRLARSFENFSDRLYWDLLQLSIRAAGVAIALWFFNPLIAGVVLGWTAIFLGSNYAFARWKLKYDIARAAKESESTGVLADAITNQNTIQLFSGRAHEIRRFGKVAEEQFRITRLNWDLRSVMEAAQGFLFIAVEFFLFFYAIRFWEQGLLTVGVFVLIQTYLFQLIHRLWDFGRVVRDLYTSIADAKEMVEILELPHEIQDVPAARPLAVSRGGIEFRDASFSFHKTRPVLAAVSLAIPSGQKVALIGPSGAGKSTLVKLLFRFHVPESGHILIDGQDIQAVTQESLRNVISLVPQDPILFHRTLAENIRYGRRDATDEEVMRASEFAHCDEFIKDLPLGYNTYVGERGIKLSGGERQRVAIARAILKNAPILVLDEATSSLDSRSEGLIQDALEKLMRGKTVIVIAHRLSTIRKMDRIVVIDEGKIVEDGTHEELLARPESLYKKLWELQAGGFLFESAENMEGGLDVAVEEDEENGKS